MTTAPDPAQARPYDVTKCQSGHPYASAQTIITNAYMITHPTRKLIGVGVAVGGRPSARSR
jgi:hypothetical protein